MKIFAADIGGTSIKTCISDLKGKIERYEEFDTESQKGGKHIIDNLLNIIAKYDEVEAIGISTAGQVNSTEGTIVYANENIPNYKGTKIKKILEDRFKVPVQVENDVNAAALGESFFGVGREFKDFLCVTFGTGIGGAIIIDSKLYKGMNGVAGEFGHIFTRSNGTNKHGNLKYESYASTTALVKEAMKIDRHCTNGRLIIDKVNQGDKRMEEIVDNWSKEVALGLASFIHIFNPPAVIVGGGIMEQDKVVSMVSQKVKEIIMDSFSDVQIIKASLGNKAGLLGAVSLHLPGSNNS